MFARDISLADETATFQGELGILRIETNAEGFFAELISPVIANAGFYGRWLTRTRAGYCGSSG